MIPHHTLCKRTLSLHCFMNYQYSPMLLSSKLLHFELSNHIYILQYIKMFEICLKFLKAECTEDWQLHLEMRCMMLQYYASLCYYNYQKSAYLCLQTTSKIQVTNHGLHKQFMNELHVIRRSNRFKAGFFQVL